MQPADGAFISADGLILSNHHVGADTLQKVSTKENDYLKKGFYAPTMADPRSTTAWGHWWSSTTP